MYAFESGTVLARPALDPPPAEHEARVDEPVCDGCGRPVPCPAATHVYRRELAADFARGYSGL
ncbi:hypothetical protein [Catellatospora chokoriensis]|uniref:Uncharacterized protein n=1 Tax=Catellatospora chokoriensis TaxID=310353 RepID=A0A8J3NQH4_9ACTN|nr:hypothetical protein [Catellatospora chokoriensis]GIF88900.1 hypothetical protein Cch02nite_23440 [Catellatospora chokoriensis]